MPVSHAVIPWKTNCTAAATLYPDLEPIPPNHLANHLTARVDKSATIRRHLIQCLSFVLAEYRLRHPLSNCQVNLFFISGLEYLIQTVHDLQSPPFWS
jgi:hypothetical protein